MIVCDDYPVDDNKVAMMIVTKLITMIIDQGSLTVMVSSGKIFSIVPFIAQAGIPTPRDPTIRVE
jgi:hypothetical protein